MPQAFSSSPAGRRTGSILIMVLLILVVAVMIASVFIATMTTYRISGTKQSARQIATQTALAAAMYAQQALIRDHASARVRNIPQRYNEIRFVPNPTYPVMGGVRPMVYAGPIPADRTGLDWLFTFEGRLAAPESAGYVGNGASAFMARYSFLANRHPSAAGGIDGTRPAVVDSLDDTQSVALQYAIWNNFQYEMVNGNTGDLGDILRFLTPFRSRYHAQPRWFTVAYYDEEFQPLPWSDRNIAAYEARFSVAPFPLDGCINTNFGERILTSTTGGCYRLGFRNPNLPPGDLEVPLNIRNSAIGSGKAAFRDDAEAFDRGEKKELTYEIGDTVSIGLSDSYPFQAYQVTDADKDWVGRSFPLSHQYAASLTNILGAMIIRDGGASVSIRKLSDVVWTTKYTNYTVNAEMVQTGGKYKASSGIGELSMLVNIVLGQGFRGNRAGYAPGIPGDPWYLPQHLAEVQVGAPTTWRQLHANMGFTSHLHTTVTQNDEILPIISYTLSPFGEGLDQTKVPYRNHGDRSTADIDCPWYLNAQVMGQRTAKGVICGMDATWYRNFPNPHGESSNIDGYPLHKGNLLPIPPPKADPVDATKIAVWDDGLSCSGADGIEGGAIPPMSSDQILATTYQRPGWRRGDIGFSFADPFESGAYICWKNPIRDQDVTTYRPLHAKPATLHKDDSDSGYTFSSPVASSNYGHVMSHSTVARAEHAKAEDFASEFLIGGNENTAIGVENAQGSQSELEDNIDTADERMAWQNDIVSALMKTLVDVRSERRHGKRLRPATLHGYEMIEDVDTVFLGFMGISVRYLPDESRASTVAASAADYQIHYDLPQPGDAIFPLGRMNQLWSLSQLTSLGPASPVNEVAYDRGRAIPTATALSFDGTRGIITNGEPGQFGFRHHDGPTWPLHEDLPGWPFPAALLPTAPSASGPYRPTWAALSRVLEHRLNDVRMSIFGTPALDLNGDLIIDATTNDGTGVVDGTLVMPGDIGHPKAQLRFSATGRLTIGQLRYWRVFIKSELWDRRSDTLADESALEQVLVLDPDGNGDQSDSQVLFSRWHASPAVYGRTGPTRAGRTEATLP